jgi:parallel beta-helix repeat protein
MTILGWCAGAAVVLGAGTGASAIGQTLDPPPGAIAPTMKPLSDVEARTAVNAGNTPGDKGAVYVIRVPGSYYLSGALAGVAGKHGIEIAASHVTLDLNGFELAGGAGTLSGVHVRKGQTNVAVRNGSVHGWGGGGIGVDVSEAPFSVVEDVRSADNGVGLLGSARCGIRRCVATGNEGGGILTGLSSVVEGCTASFNKTVGMYVPETSRVINCTFEGNAADGLYLDGAGCVVTGCTAVSNGRHGIGVIYGALITGCLAERNAGTGFWSIAPITLTGCQSTLNTVDGAEAGEGSAVSACVFTGNGRDGVRVGGSGGVRDCQASGQVKGAGIRVVGAGTRVEGNALAGNSTGVRVESKGCVIVGNRAWGSLSQAFEIASGNAFGTIVNAAGAGDLGAVPGAGALANIAY